MEEASFLSLWKKFESLYLNKSLANMLYLKKLLQTIHMEEVDEFNKIIIDLKNIDIKIKEEEYIILLLSSLARSFEHFI